MKTKNPCHHHRTPLCSGTPQSALRTVRLLLRLLLLLLLLLLLAAAAAAAVAAAAAETLVHSPYLVLVCVPLSASASK